MQDTDHDPFEAAVEELPQVLGVAVRNWRDALPQDAGDGLADWPGDAAKLVRLIACSEFAARVVSREWRWFCDASEELDRPYDRRRLASDFDRLAASAGADGDIRRALRVARNRELVRVLWRDLNGCATLEDTLAALSDLADCAICAAVESSGRELEERCGRILVDGEAQPLVVLAMGKLGGRELNFSSDIDLVFLHPADGESDGPRRLSAHEYFTRQARRVVTLLEEATADGFVYRVDTRLRPFGDSGPPVVSYAALENYLLQHGRDWERYAYVKARIVSPSCPGPAVEALKKDIIEPFVYRRYLDYGVFESLREMHSLVAAEVQRREMANNVKLGPGGIREVEFIVQSLQILRGGSVPSLRTSRLHAALHRAVEVRELTREIAGRLRETYEFLRRLENAIQALRDQQTHMLPQGEADRARVALALRYPDWAALVADLERHREFVSGQFAAIAFRNAPEPAEAEAGDVLTTLWQRRADAGEWESALEGLGMREARETAERVAAFAALPSTQRVDSTSANRLRQFLSTLLPRLAGREAPARTLDRVLQVVDRILRRSAYLALLNENPAVLDRLLDLCERSARLAEEIARFPLLLDEMLDPRLFGMAPDAEQMRVDLRSRMRLAAPDDSEGRIEVLAQFRRATLFRLAVADISGSLPIMKVSDRLTELAEIILEQALEIARRDLVARHGEPCYELEGQRRTAGMGIIAYGKLGGIELSYGSDLDLVFLHDSRGEQQETTSDKPLENSMFFARLARRLVHFLTAETGSGILYEIDTRLRPSGRSGLLVTSLEAFERYQEENAWTWEHQALLRSRPIAGSAVVAREFERIRAQTLRQRVRRESLVEDVRDMRAKMRRQLDRSDGQVFDLKQGSGGIADIEFLVQYLVLANADRNAAVIHYTDNIRQLGTLAASRCLSEEDSRELQEIYKRYRARLHRLVLDDLPPLVDDREFGPERERVRALWARWLGDA